MRELALRDASGLRIRARRDATTALTGAYRSAFRGAGLTFEELREYVAGDDVRWIEWNATARHGRPIVKRMREERDLVVALLVDVSDSLDAPRPGAESKRRAARRVAAALASAAVRVQDRVALATFAVGLRASLPPARGPLQLERVFRALEDPRGGAPTDAGPALEWAAAKLPRHSIVVLISDFLFDDPGPALRQCARKHELVALALRDRADRVPPRMAPVRVRGAESARPALWRRRAEPTADLRLAQGMLRSLGADVAELWTGPALLGGLHRFFEERARRTI